MASSVIKQCKNVSNIRILDYGCGDGELFKHIRRSLPEYHKARFDYVGFDPMPKMIKCAQDKIKDDQCVCFITDMRKSPFAKFDYIFCLEVFEHLDDDSIRKVLLQLKEKLSGILVIGVPNELYLWAMIRGCFRMYRSYGDFDATPMNVFKSVIGRVPVERPTTTLSTENGRMPFISSHMGFDYRVLKELIGATLSIETILGSPFPTSPLFFNSEINFVCRMP